ncbi:hypothetical protein TIFTF001_017744 [Ficus carica]|uniref:Uncharacterized protein n=1 Tax=Ficus carica TaxID=3494 RepID=A0AA88A5N9_FICCA|nr:hypothetical protein TIFTF001_017744 [Ficus carica]
MVVGVGVRGYREADSSTWEPVGRNTRVMNSCLGTREHQSCRNQWLHSNLYWVYCATVQWFSSVIEAGFQNRSRVLGPRPSFKSGLGLGFQYQGGGLGLSSGSGFKIEIMVSIGFQDRGLGFQYKEHKTRLGLGFWYPQRGGGEFKARSQNLTQFQTQYQNMTTVLKTDPNPGPKTRNPSQCNLRSLT